MAFPRRRVELALPARAAARTPCVGWEVIRAWVCAKVGVTVALVAVATVVAVVVAERLL